LRSFGTEYAIRNGAYIVLSLVAMWTRRPRFHELFAVAGVIYQLSWIVREFETL
jgi:hypothetical protein